MAQTFPAVAQLFGIEEQTLARFRDSLSLDDRRVLDDLLDSTENYNLAVDHAAETMPAEIVLLTMLMEHHKIVRFLVDRLDYYHQKMYFNQVKRQPNTSEKRVKR